jgi:hypothetical protein
MFCPEPYPEVTEAKVQEHLAKHADITISSGINSVDLLGWGRWDLGRVLCLERMILR